MSAPADAPAHIPVLLDEMLQALRPATGETIIDGTFGAGGYTRAILQAADCRVLALDRDPTAIAAGSALVAKFPDRLTLVESPFRDIEQVARQTFGRADGGDTGDGVDGVVLDIGVSSMQIDDPARGFSFMGDGPLDMRMGGDGLSAADVVRDASEAYLAAIIGELGEERHAGRVARAIGKARLEAPITSTRQLADLVTRAIGRFREPDKHPATRTFQALRIHVNDELGELCAALRAAECLLGPGGRLVIVCFHSLEDRIVKRFLARRATRQAQGSRHLPPTESAASAQSFRIVNQRPVSASDRETAANPRARSAKLRSAVRTEADPWPPEDPADLGVPRFEAQDRR